MTREISPGELHSLDVARQLTELQVQTAQKIFKEEFGDGTFDAQLLSAVITAMATNYSTTRLYSKTVFKS